ncbi:unnamed protein product [Bursaphelenchus xylophilus]|uniref:(pine wood nematode) hypothetical protein n=1 Tax=Bursaphelenchus xylophilus TaxID=6326 RepID=A0A1I7SDC5_BURXY|nr:unnamed protein product [Bursaphelenchus xylophilus]CAG9130597.1 unnamed protein product [Bursaphelenchus xylophilus]
MFSFTLIFIHFVLITSGTVCNQHTSYECNCTSCHRIFEDQENSVTVEFEECNNASGLNLDKIREKIGNWVREECAFILRCKKASRNIDVDNVLITDFVCLEGMESRISFLVRWNASGDALDKSNCFPRETLVEVILAREHLLATLLDSTLLQVVPSTVQPRIKSTTTWKQIIIIALISALFSFLFAGIIAFCVALNVIGFQRFFGWLCPIKSKSKELQELSELSRRNQQLELAEWD